jgi:hypothetical protein
MQGACKISVDKYHDLLEDSKLNIYWSKPQLLDLKIFKINRKYIQ